MENEVSTALEILLEEIETAVEELNQEGSRLFALSEHKKARLLLEKAEAAISFREKVKGLQIEWRALETQIGSKPPKERKRTSTKRRAKLERGLRTPEEEYKAPILEALIHFGGSADITDVIAYVEKTMASKLNDHDKEPLPSTPSFPRWRNTAQWARNALVQDGLMANDSPKGTWAITDAGRKVITNG